MSAILFSFQHLATLESILRWLISRIRESIRALQAFFLLSFFFSVNCLMIIFTFFGVTWQKVVLKLTAAPIIFCILLLKLHAILLLFILWDWAEALLTVSGRGGLRDVEYKIILHWEYLLYNINMIVDILNLLLYYGAS